MKPGRRRQRNVAALEGSPVSVRQPGQERQPIETPVWHRLSYRDLNGAGDWLARPRQSIGNIHKSSGDSGMINTPAAVS